MPSMQLPGRALVTVSGPDAQPFLQNIVTTDLESLAETDLRACALLSPQGKILFDFLVSRSGDGFRLDCRGELAADFAKRLTMYRLRAKADIAVTEGAPVGVAWASAGEAEMPGLDDTRFLPELRVRRVYVPVESKGDTARWDELRVRNGVAESGSDYTLGDAFPHDVLLDQNGGVGFKKGCFVGQEVVSRMQHRGTARRRILVAESAAPLPASGADVTAEARVIGTLGTVVDRVALASVRIDRVADAIAAGAPITAEGVPLSLHVPPGMRFVVPEAGSAA